LLKYLAKRSSKRAFGKGGIARTVEGGREGAREGATADARFFLLPLEGGFERGRVGGREGGRGGTADGSPSRARRGRRWCV
jgi:hypothetical protein